MKFPKARTGPRHVLLKIVEHGELSFDEIISFGISTETKQRNKVIRILASLTDAECIYVVKNKYRATEEAAAYAEDVMEMESAKPKTEIVGAPYVKEFWQAGELKGYAKIMYQNKRGYD